MGYLPSIAQWHQVVNLQIRRRRPSCPIVGTHPRPTCSRAGGIHDYARTITLEYGLPRVTGPRYSDLLRWRLSSTFLRERNIIGVYSGFRENCFLLENMCVEKTQPQLSNTAGKGTVLLNSYAPSEGRGYGSIHLASLGPGR